MLEKLKELIYSWGLPGNCFVPFRNDESHNYENGKAYKIVNVVANEGRSIFLRGQRGPSNTGNSISMHNLRLIYTTEGIKNMLNTIQTLKDSLAKLEEEYVEIHKEMEERRITSYDPKTVKMEKMLELLQKQGTSPQEIVAKIFAANEQY